MLDEVKTIYQKQALKCNALDEKDKQLQIILKYLPHEKNSNILDAGCGNGKYSAFLYNKGYKNTYGIDLFDEIAEEKIKYKKCSIENTDFQSETFDFIFCNSSIYYTKNIKNTLTEIKRISRKNAYIFISAHTKYSLYTLLRIAKRSLSSKETRHLKNVEFHSAFYYKKIINSLGLLVIEQDGFTQNIPKNPIRKILHHMMCILYKILPKEIRSEIMYHSYFVIKK